MTLFHEIIGLYRDHPFFFAGLASIMGAIIGSFLNVVAYRLPKVVERQYVAGAHALLELGEPPAAVPLSLSKPDSHCPTCLTPIRWFDNIPILSWLMLRGRCRACGTSIPVRYVLIEAVTAGVTCCMALAYGPTPQFLVASIVAWHLIAIALIDAEHQIVFDEIVMPALLVLAVVASIGAGVVGALDSVQGLVVGYLPLLGLWKVLDVMSDRPLLGQGDAGIMAVVGATLGPLPAVATLFAASALHTAVALLFFRKERTLPFAPAICTVAIVHIMCFPFMRAGLW